MNRNQTITEKEALLITLLSKQEDIFEQATAMHRLCTAHGLKQGELAILLRVSQSTVGNKIRLLQFSPRERDSILRFGLSERHARTLLRINPPKREKLIETVGNLRLTVQQTEELVEKYTHEQNVPALVATRGHSDDYTVESFVSSTQTGADKLRLIGHKVSCLVESDDARQKITVIIHKQADGFT